MSSIITKHFGDAVVVYKSFKLGNFFANHNLFNSHGHLIIYRKKS